MNFFDHKNVDIEALRKKAFNFRWATLDPDVIPLTSADPDFPVFHRILDAMNEYMSDGYFSYSPSAGLPSFREAIAKWYLSAYNVVADPRNILPVNSAAQALYIVANTLLKNGDEVIIPDPVDFLFRRSVEHVGAIVKPLAISIKDSSYDIAELEQSIGPNTKAIYVCNPNNPMALYQGSSNLKSLVQIAKKYDLWLISDEIWLDIHHGTPLKSITDPSFETYQKKIIVSGLSKNFGLAGLRVGYIITFSDEIYQSIFKASHHEHTGNGVGSLPQVAGTAAYLEGSEWLDAFRNHLIEMKNLTKSFIQEASFLEDYDFNATYLAFPAYDPALNRSSVDMIEYILQKSRVALVPGGINWFESKSEGRIRICYATSKEIATEAFERILNSDI